MAFSPLFAQTPAAAQAPNPNQQEVIVKLQQMAPLPAPQTATQKANEWVDFGKNVGTAMDAGLTSLTDHAEKFSKTDAGRFTMAIIAWKVAGRDALEVTKYVTDTVLHIVVGIPLLVTWICIVLWFVRRNFMTHTVLLKKSGSRFKGTLERVYKVVNEDELSEGRRIGCVLSCFASIIVGAVIISAVIL